MRLVKKEGALCNVRLEQKMHYKWNALIEGQWSQRLVTYECFNFVRRSGNSQRHLNYKIFRAFAEVWKAQRMTLTKDKSKAMSWDEKTRLLCDSWASCFHLLPCKIQPLFSCYGQTNYCPELSVKWKSMSDTLMATSVYSPWTRG